MFCEKKSRYFYPRLQKHNNLMNLIQRTGIKEVLEDKTTLFSLGKTLLSGSVRTGWYEIHFNRENRIQAKDTGQFVELHFQFNGFSKTLCDDKEVLLYPNSQSIFYVNNFEGAHELYKDNSDPFTFFEIKLDLNAIKKIFPEKVWQELSFMRNLLNGTTSFIDSIRPVTPQMKCVIYDMCNSPFKETVEEVYLKAKVIELFLLQAESHKTPQNTDLRKTDVDKLIATKEFIDRNYQEKIRIIDLAKIAGTNQQLLKKGFKTMFGTTIFGYYNDLRMEKARHLLLESGKSVAEVSDEIGYKNPQHFTVAFKKKFGLLPKDLKGVE
jgi:AraC-like DNA-binding protein